MVSEPSAGVRARATTDAPNENNSGGCAFCERPADGLDAVSGEPVCKHCADVLRTALEDATAPTDDCAHSRVRRFGRSNATGAIIEERCADCGRTLSLGGDA
jgi:hypothetical protein